MLENTPDSIIPGKAKASVQQQATGATPADLKNSGMPPPPYGVNFALELHMIIRESKHLDRMGFQVSITSSIVLFCIAVDIMRKYIIFPCRNYLYLTYVWLASQQPYGRIGTLLPGTLIILYSMQHSTYTSKTRRCLSYQILKHALREGKAYCSIAKVILFSPHDFSSISWTSLSAVHAETDQAGHFTIRVTGVHHYVRLYSSMASNL